MHNITVSKTNTKLRIFQIEEWMNSVVAENSELLKEEILGYSYENRKINAITVSYIVASCTHPDYIKKFSSIIN